MFWPIHNFSFRHQSRRNQRDLRRCCWHERRRSFIKIDIFPVNWLSKRFHKKTLRNLTTIIIFVCHKKIVFKIFLRTKKYFILKNQKTRDFCKYDVIFIPYCLASFITCNCLIKFKLNFILNLLLNFNYYTCM